MSTPSFSPPDPADHLTLSEQRALVRLGPERFKRWVLAGARSRTS